MEGKFFKWWKNKTALSIIGIALGSVLLAFLFAYFFTWGWYVSIAIALGGGYWIRTILFKKLNEMADKYDNEY